METKGFSHIRWDPSQKCTTNKRLLTAILSSSETAVIKIEAHAEKTEAEHQGNAPALSCEGRSDRF